MTTRKLSKPWLQSYLEYTEKTESPEIFHLWSGLSVIAASLGRKCYIERGFFRNYPNQYIILVAASAKCRKTTATDIGAISIYDKVHLDERALRKITIEKLYLNLDRRAKLTGESSCYLYSPELSVMMGSIDNNGFMNFLTDVYTCPDGWVNDTKNKGCDKLVNLCINFLGCTNPGDLSTMPKSMIDGGFAGRVIYVYGDKPRPPIPDPMAFYTPEIIQLKLNLIEDLKVISTIEGIYQLDDKAKKLYEELYVKNYHREDMDFRLHPYQGRKMEHVLSISMLLAASRYDGLVIDSHDIDRAHYFLTQLEGRMADSFSEVAYSQSTKYLDLVKNIIRDNNGEIKRYLLVKKVQNKMKARELDELIATLRESKSIEEDKSNKGGMVYRLIK